MANNAISAIRSALQTNLSAVSLLKQVKSGRTTEFDKFVCCRHYLVGVGDRDFDTANNERSYRFGIDIIMPYAIEGMEKDTAEGLFQDAVDAVLDKLNAEWDDNVDHSIVETGSVRQLEDWPQGPAVILTIIWQAKTLITI